MKDTAKVKVFRVYDSRSKSYPLNQEAFFINSDGTLFATIAEEKYNAKTVPQVVECNPEVYTVEWFSGQQDTMYPVSRGPIYEQDVLGLYLGDEVKRCGYVEYDSDLGDFVIHTPEGWERLSQYLMSNNVEVMRTTHDESPGENYAHENSK